MRMDAAINFRTGRITSSDMVGYRLKLISAIGQHRKQALDSGDGYSDMRFTAKCTPVAWANNRALEMRSDTLATSASVARLRIVADYGPHDAAREAPLRRTESGPGDCVKGAEPDGLCAGPLFTMLPCVRSS